MEPIRMILFPTKFENLSFACLERLVSLKAFGLEEVVFLFVIDRDEVSYNLFSGFDRDLAEQLREQARLRFVDWGKELAERGLRSRHVIEIGSPEGKILEISCREEVGLIVAGRQTEKPSDGVYLGGTTMGVLRRSAIPVFVCKHGGVGACDVPGSSPFAHVLFATDFSEDADRALEFIHSLGAAVEKLEVVHVMTDRDFHKHTPEEVREEEGQARQRMQTVCEQFEAKGIPAEWHLRAGHTAQEIMNACTDHHASVIVMGTKGRHGLKEMWLGSCSHRVAELAEVPVVLVPLARAECYI